MHIYSLRRCDSSIGIGKATRHHEFNNDEIGFCLLFSSRNRLSWTDCISTAIKYAILYLYIILLVLPDTFYLGKFESGSGFDRIRIRIRIRSVLRGRIRIRSKSVRIRNTDMETWTWRQSDGDGNTETLKHTDTETWRHQTENGSTGDFPISLPFVHYVNGNLTFVRLLQKKQTEVIRLHTD